MMTRASSQRISSFHVRVILAVAAAGVAGGCAEVTIRPNTRLLPANRVYSDHDWDLLLQQCLREGLVDYDVLAANHEPLDRYYALISITGPTRTPDQFPTRTDKTAYWINAYNALVLLAVLQRYPTPTMYDLALPVLEQQYKFMVDGKVYNLAAIEEQMLNESNHDVRTLFAASSAAMGTPQLASVPYRPASLDDQLAAAAERALDNPHLCRVDHATKTLLVWQKILRRRDDFVLYWRTRRRVQTAYVFNVLLDMASPARRRVLQSAVGYRFGEVPFNRNLNHWTARAGQPAVP